MTLWNIIRDFFVQYIFGGITSDGISYNNMSIGLIDYYKDGVWDDSVVETNNTLRVLFNSPDGYVLALGYGDWLSTTFTIITLIAICVFLFLVVRWLFRLTAGLISGRG